MGREKWSRPKVVVIMKGRKEKGKHRGKDK
jgi:hypothetical protein